MNKNLKKKLFSKDYDEANKIKSPSKRIEAISRINQKIEYYEIAQDFEYSETVLDKILKSKTLIEAENILIDARRKN